MLDRINPDYSNHRLRAFFDRKSANARSEPWEGCRIAFPGCRETEAAYRRFPDYRYARGRSGFLWDSRQADPRKPFGRRSFPTTDGRMTDRTLYFRVDSIFGEPYTDGFLHYGYQIWLRLRSRTKSETPG